MQARCSYVAPSLWAAAHRGRYRPTTFPRFHANLTRSTRLPILSS